VGDERAALQLPTVAERTVALPPNADLEVEGISPFVTPNADFYRIDTALSVPQVSKDEWSLRIHGMVERDLELTFDDLLARDQIEEYVTLSCVSNPVGGPYVGNALWQGVRLDGILAEVGVHPDATQLVSRSIDGWTCGTPVSSVIDGRNAMLAIAMNGEPLPAEHGYPVRMVVPGEYGYVSATKWVVDMELTTWDAYDAYWVPRGWAQQAPMKMMTRIETPRNGSEVRAGTVAIAGTAWAVHTGISAVEVRVDGGDWMRATLGGVPSPDTWRKWSVQWQADSGAHRIEARATNSRGEVQTSERADVAPDGASGYHEIRVNIT
jgi:DMSO/TMAO reductase YedYZ molybdopterin-dependent catalytic subunit